MESLGWLKFLGKKMKKRIKNQKNNSSIFFKIKKAGNLFLPYLFLFFLPTQLTKHFFFSFSYINGVRIDYLAPAIYLIDVIFLLLLIFNLSLFFSFLKEKKVLLVFFIFLINLLFSQSKIISFFYLLKIFQLFFVFYLFYKIKLNDFYLLLSFLLITLVEIFLAFYQLKFGRSFNGLFYFFGERQISLSIPGIAKISFFGKELLRPYATFSHPNSLAGFYLLLYVFFLTNKHISPFVFLKNLMLILCALLVFFSFSKITILSFLIINLVFYFQKQKNCPFCFLAKSTVFFSLASIFITAKGDILSLLKRLELIKQSFKIISQHPVFGIGIGTYLLAQKNFSSFYPLFFNQPVHNIFLLLLAEIGFPSFIFLSWLFFSLIKNLSLKKNSSFFFLILTVFFTGLFDHYWLTIKQNLLVLGVLAGVSLKRS